MLGLKLNHISKRGHSKPRSPMWNIWLNSLAPGRSGFNFKCAIFNLVLLIGIFRSFYDNALRWMSWDLSEDKTTLVQVMAWCRQPSHYLSQCSPRSLSPYGVTRPQWVKPIVNHLQLGNPTARLAGHKQWISSLCSSQHYMLSIQGSRMHCNRLLPQISSQIKHSQDLS